MTRADEARDEAAEHRVSRLERLRLRLLLQIDRQQPPTTTQRQQQRFSRADKRQRRQNADEQTAEQRWLEALHRILSGG